MSIVKNESYITIQGWMKNELNLGGYELMVYAIIYGFSQDQRSEFTGSRQYISDWCGCNVRTVQRTLNSLMDKKLITKTKTSSGTLKTCHYVANVPTCVKTSYIKCDKKDTKTCDKITRNNIVLKTSDHNNSQKNSQGAFNSLNLKADHHPKGDNGLVRENCLEKEKVFEKSSCIKRENKKEKASAEAEAERLSKIRKSKKPELLVDYIANSSKLSNEAKTLVLKWYSMDSVDVKNKINLARMEQIINNVYEECSSEAEILEAINNAIRHSYKEFYKVQNKSRKYNSVNRLPEQRIAKDVSNDYVF